MAKLNKDQGNKETQVSREQAGGKHIDQDDRELEKLEREQQKARSGDDPSSQGNKGPTPHR